MALYSRRDKVPVPFGNVTKVGNSTGKYHSLADSHRNNPKKSFVDKLPIELLLGAFSLIKVLQGEHDDDEIRERIRTKRGRGEEGGAKKGGGEEGGEEGGRKGLTGAEPVRIPPPHKTVIYANPNPSCSDRLLCLSINEIKSLALSLSNSRGS